MKIAKIAAAIALAAAAGSASAQVYGEVAYHALNVDESGIENLSIGALGVTLGYEAHPNLAVEAMLAVGVQDDSVTVSGIRVEGQLDNSMGLFLKPKLRVADGLELFARLGWAHSKITVRALGVSLSDDGNDLAYGLGAQYSFNKNMYVTGSYMNLYNKNDFKVDGWNIGLGYKF